MENTKQWEKSAFLLQKKLKYEHLTVKQICAFWKNLKEKKKKAKRETRAYDQADGNFGELLGWSEQEVEERALRVLEETEEHKVQDVAMEVTLPLGAMEDIGAEVEAKSEGSVGFLRNSPVDVNFMGNMSPRANNNNWTFNIEFKYCGCPMMCDCNAQ